MFVKNSHTTIIKSNMVKISDHQNYKISVINIEIINMNVIKHIVVR